MKRRSASTVSNAFVPPRPRLAPRLIGATVLTLALLAGSAAQGVTVISKVSNAAVYLGLSFTQLEFENPLAGTETVLSYSVLDWRDAGNGKSLNERSMVAWTGPCWVLAAPEKTVRLYKSTYTNPFPETEVVQIDFISAMTRSAPFLVAMTVE